MTRMSSKRENSARRVQCTETRRNNAARGIRSMQHPQPTVENTVPQGLYTGVGVVGLSFNKQNEEEHDRCTATWNQPSACVVVQYEEHAPGEEHVPVFGRHSTFDVCLLFQKDEVPPAGVY